MDVSVIIVNYNTRLLTIDSIRSVTNYVKNVSYEIILVDNASSDGSITAIQQEFPLVKIIANQENIGFGRANNKGISIAQGEFVFLLNSDAFLTSDALSDFCAFMRKAENKKVAVCGADLHTGGSEKTISYGNFPSLLDSFSTIGFYILYHKFYFKYIASGVVNTDNSIRQVDYINGSNMFIRKSVLNEVGAFDEDFFLYFEETELSYRIKKNGYVSYILPYIKIIHLAGGSQKSKDFNYNQHYHFSRGRNLYFEKCHGKTYAFLVKICNVFWEITMAVSGRRKGNIFKKISGVFS